MSDDAEPITSASSLGGRRPLSRRAVLGGLGVIAAAGATTAYGPVEAASAAPTVTKIKNLLVSCAANSLSIS